MRPCKTSPSLEALVVDNGIHRIYAWGVCQNKEEFDKDIAALLDLNAKLKESGYTSDQIKENAEAQALAVKVYLESLESLEALAYDRDETFEATCNKVNGHWAPPSIRNFYYHLMGVDLEAIEKSNAQQQ